MARSRFESGLESNLLLRSLAPQDFQRLSGSVELVTVPHGRVLKEIGEPSRYVYFPSTAVLSIVVEMANGAGVEICTVGREGALGLGAAFGANILPYRALVPVGDGVYRMPASVFLSEFARGGGFQRATLRYMAALLVLTGQTAACNRLHETTARLCRWLLTCRDRLETDELRVTHEFLSQLLGAGRTGVTLAIGGLERSGALRHSRGKLVLLNREKLEASACECYAVIREELASCGAPS